MIVEYITYDDDMTDRMNAAVYPARFQSCEIWHWGDLNEEDRDRIGCAIVADGVVMYSISYARVTCMNDALESWLEDFCRTREYERQPQPQPDPEQEDESIDTYLERLFAG